MADGGTGMIAEQFAGSAFIVTGAASGIGKAVATALVDRGAAVLAVDASGDGLERLCRSSLARERIVPVELDLADPDTYRKLGSAVDDFHAARLAGAVNCAAIVGVSGVMAQDIPSWDRLFAINLRAPMLITQLVAQRSSPRAPASIVHISSTAARIARAGLAAYASSKAALEQLTRVQAIELAAQGVRVNAIRVGLVDTEGVRAALKDDESERAHRRKIGRIPMKRTGLPAEVAELACFLLGPASSFCTGSVYPIDGGYSAGIAEQECG
ncbi:MAG: SDR family oxidoreductase [Aquamicrobium sp.]|uniref:SDR family NAD(P)-dependent oxidoreductase n=1 Tax=Aquamicrobium sp. TaxID=1872579 RepID=UPI00349E8A59|nr:SDR family oxidoreductase [Aquamicrobium sp.]